ncbi:HPF/RaiA family ribosome-associated protein [Marinobacterium lutimaris]|uniref:Ribosomal subunit interface protein n=1 Tax=Marinobacterium lutimaris TaxID=568106 RepID=A0A1H5YIW6_9GAMM|nr:HPF/RaiA family ribosome-associated protein [Marinobacterium lutimaris]SEG24008.1 hypothetical protein SAMN05444390_1011784 [Marinobacterium lutimaris]
MITAVNFRHGIDNPAAMQRIQSRLDRIASKTSQARRIDVVLDRIAYDGSPACNYECHISFRGKEKKNLDIRADKRHPDMAIDDAFDRLNMALSGSLNRRNRKRRAG